MKRHMLRALLAIAMLIGCGSTRTEPVPEESRLTPGMAKLKIIKDVTTQAEILEIFGSPDDMKLRSCATLFASVSPAGSAFDRLLDKYFEGQRDDKTLCLAGIAPKGG